MVYRLVQSDIKARVIISGYQPKPEDEHAEGEDLFLYDNSLLPRGWYRYLLAEVVNQASSKKQLMQEWIWTNWKLSVSQTNFLKSSIPIDANKLELQCQNDSVIMPSLPLSLCEEGGVADE